MIDIALLGFGNIGGGTAEVITENRELIEKQLGTALNIKYILDLRDFPESPFGHLVVHRYDVILNDPDVKIVVEMMGGSHPAYEYTKAALLAGKSVVSSNKECVANFGAELLAIAAEKGCRYLFEASVGGGIPVIRPMMVDLAPVHIKSVSAILNGTTNYILTKMANEGLAFADVLADAQKKGYAEANPAADVEGLDAARKIVILAALASGVILNADEISREGITKITDTDMKTAESFGYTIKLIGRFEKAEDGKILCMVSPRFVSKANPLYTVSDVFNGILVDSDMLGEVMFYGKGAGKLPTAGAVVSDILDAASPHRVSTMQWRLANADDIADVESYSCGRVFSFEGNEGDLDEIKRIFNPTSCLVENGKISIITDAMTERSVADALSICSLKLISKFRTL
ncbi:MAG: homoserine dehydrogenase [Clostridia bacterium]|nr:homoserine dehydrogenase [Clostridia bacterium]